LGTRAEAQEQEQDPTGVPRANFLPTARREKEVADRANQNFSAFTLNFLSTHKICLIKIFVQNL